MAQYPVFYKAVCQRKLVQGRLSFRGYWRPNTNAKWQRVDNTQGLPIEYTERRYAIEAARICFLESE